MEPSMGPVETESLFKIVRVDCLPEMKLTEWL